MVWPADSLPIREELLQRVCRGRRVATFTDTSSEVKPRREALLEDLVPPLASGDLLVEPHLKTLLAQKHDQPSHILRVGVGVADEDVPTRRPSDLPYPRLPHR
jgi:hypothetical protein